MRRWLVVFLLYLLVANEGPVYGPFDSYAACWKSRQDKGINGQCVAAWPQRAGRP